MSESTDAASTDAVGTESGALLKPEALDDAVAAARKAFDAAPDLPALAVVKPAHLGDRAPVLLARRALGSLPGPERAEAGRRVNAARTQVQEAFDARRTVLEAERDERVLVRGRRRHPAVRPHPAWCTAPDHADRRAASRTCSSRWATRSPRGPRSSRRG